MKVECINMKVLLLTFLFLMPSFCILASGNDTECLNMNGPLVE